MVVYYQPTSLVVLAAQKTAKEASLGTAHAIAYPTERKKLYDIRWTATQLSSDLQNQLVPYYKGADLAEFITGHHSIKHFQKFVVNDDDFQKFLFHFFRQKELESIPMSEKAKLDAHYFKFKSDFENNYVVKITIKNKRVMVNVNSFDWATRSMGFDHPILSQNLPFFTHFENFFLIKFEQPHSFERFPAPKLPQSVLNVIPAQVDYSTENFYFHELLLTGSQPDMYPNFPKEPKKLSEKFFFRLSAMAAALENHAHQEVLVYASQLLERPDFKNNPYLQEFIFHVWGMLAVSLAKMNLAQNLIFSCLNEMNKTIRIQSQNWDAVLYKQHVMAALGWQCQETQMFRLFFNHVPRTSLFYKQSLNLHFKSMIQTIENFIMEIFVLKQKKEMVLMNQLVEKVNICIRHLQKTLHNVFSKREMCKKEDLNIFQYFALLDLYSLLLQQIVDKNKISEKERNDLMLVYEIQLKGSEHFIEFFLLHFCSETSFNDFQSDFEMCHSWIKNTSHLENPMIWASCIFTHVLFLKVLDEFHNPALQFARDAMEMYQKTNHFRASLLKDFIQCLDENNPRIKTYKMPTFSQHCFSNFDFLTLLQKQPMLKHLIRFGMETIAHFDFRI